MTNAVFQNEKIKQDKENLRIDQSLTEDRLLCNWMDRLQCNWIFEGGFIENVTFAQRFEGSKRIKHVDMLGWKRLQQRKQLCQTPN